MTDNTKELDVRQLYKTIVDSTAILFDHGLKMVAAQNPETAADVKAKIENGSLKIYAEIDLAAAEKTMLKFFDQETDELIFFFDPTKVLH